jgi:hypothetical protein
MKTLVVALVLLLPALPGAKKEVAKKGAGNAAAAAAATPPADGSVFDPAEIRVPVGTSTGRKAYVDVEGFEGKNLVSVTDLPSEVNDRVKVTFTNPKRVSTAQNIWSIDLAIQDMPATVSLTRHAQLAFAGGGTDTITYELSSRPKTFSWSVDTGPKVLSYEPNDRFTINVTATGASASNLRLASSSLQSTDDFAIDTDMLTLSPATKPIPDGTPTQFAVVFDTAKIPSGTYTGSVGFAVDESPDVKTVEMTFNSSTRRTRLLGLVAIFAGVFLSLLIGVVLRSIVTNGEAMLPASKLGEIALAHAAKIKDTCKVAERAPKTLQALDDIRINLSAKNLRAKRYLRPWIANPFGTTSASAEELTAYLQEQSDHLTAIGYLIDNGLCVAAGVTVDPRKPEQLAARDKLFKDLDALSSLKKVDELKTRIPPLFEVFKKTSATEGLFNVRGVVPTTQQLLFRVTVVSAFGWLIVLIVTVVTGYAMLIANDRGFGSIGDLLLCFLWGLGVQTAGQQLTATSSSSVLGSLGFTSPTPTT